MRIGKGSGRARCERKCPKEEPPFRFNHRCWLSGTLLMLHRLPTMPQSHQEDRTKCPRSLRSQRRQQSLQKTKQSSQTKKEAKLAKKQAKKAKEFKSKVSRSNAFTRPRAGGGSLSHTPNRRRAPLSYGDVLRCRSAISRSRAVIACSSAWMTLTRTASAAAMVSHGFKF